MLSIVWPSYEKIEKGRGEQRCMYLNIKFSAAANIKVIISLANHTLHSRKPDGPGGGGGPLVSTMDGPGGTLIGGTVHSVTVHSCVSEDIL